jgi:hypothetical protein
MVASLLLPVLMLAAVFAAADPVRVEADDPALAAAVARALPADSAPSLAGRRVVVRRQGDTVEVILSDASSRPPRRVSRRLNMDASAGRVDAAEVIALVVTELENRHFRSAAPPKEPAREPAKNSAKDPAKEPPKDPTPVARDVTAVAAPASTVRVADEARRSDSPPPAPVVADASKRRFDEPGLPASPPTIAATDRSSTGPSGGIAPTSVRLAGSAGAAMLVAGAVAALGIAGALDVGAGPLLLRLRGSYFSASQSGARPRLLISGVSVGPRWQPGRFVLDLAAGGELITTWGGGLTGPGAAIAADGAATLRLTGHLGVRVAASIGYAVVTLREADDEVDGDIASSVEVLPRKLVQTNVGVVWSF